MSPRLNSAVLHLQGKRGDRIEDLLERVGVIIPIYMENVIFTTADDIEPPPPTPSPLPVQRPTPAPHPPLAALSVVYTHQTKGDVPLVIVCKVG